MPTYRLDVAYDGSGFHGYARQADVRTVQGDLEEALFKHTGAVETRVAGRTDAGVHARGQVVSLRIEAPLDVDALQRSLNSQLAPEIVVTSVREVGNGFDARFSAESRRYRYRVLNRPVPDPFLRHVAWHIADPLDIGAMREAARHFEGTHDFASFCRAAPGRSTERTVLAAAWEDSGSGQLHFDITGTSFCHQMVRSLVALMVEVGRCRLATTEVPGIIAARDRNAARGAAPPHGLTLWAVGYPGEGA